MPSAGIDLRRLKVLLVEDNADDAFLLERHLRRNGFDPQMTRVETAEEMLSAMNATDLPEVVLADYNLPNFSGPAALKLLRGTGEDLPFIMMSGAISEEAAVASMRAGAHDYVTKQNLARLVPALERELRDAGTRRSTRAAERALMEAEARFHRLVEAMPLGLLISDAEGRITYANGAVERLLGYPEGGLSQSVVRVDQICPDLAKAHLGLRDGTGVAEPFEAACTTTAGHRIDVLIGVAQLDSGEGGERQVAAFLADLSLQKKSEEMLRRTEKLAVAGRLAASIAHEINNPLEAVTNCLYLVGQGELSRDSREYLDMAQKELNRVAQITVQTLRFYRRSTRPSQTDIPELLEAVVALFESRLNRAEIEVVRDFRDTPTILAHDGEIRQVMANLVSNGLDAMGRGGRLVLRTMASRCWRTDRQGVRVTVADNGTGMDRETLGRIFEAFYSTKGVTGTGLGLWVSQEIVEKHQGRMHVRTRLATKQRRGGTVFSLFLPLAGSFAVEEAG